MSGAAQIEFVESSLPHLLPDFSDRSNGCGVYGRQCLLSFRLRTLEIHIPITDETSAHPVYGTALYVDFLTRGDVSGREKPLHCNLIARFDKIPDVVNVARIILHRGDDPLVSHHLLTGQGSGSAPQVDHYILAEVGQNPFGNARSPCFEILLDEFTNWASDCKLICHGIPPRRDLASSHSFAQAKLFF